MIGEEWNKLRFSSLGNESRTTAECYIDNIKNAVSKIRDYTNKYPEVILITSMHANTIWNYISGGSVVLAVDLHKYAEKQDCLWLMNLKGCNQKEFIGE